MEGPEHIYSTGFIDDRFAVLKTSIQGTPTVRIYSGSHQAMVLGGQKQLVFHPPVSWESGVKTVVTVPQIVQLITWEKRKRACSTKQDCRVSRITKTKNRNGYYLIFPFLPVS